MLHHFSLFKIIDENFHKVNNLVLEICCNFHTFPSTNFALMKQVILLFDGDAKIKPWIWGGQIHDGGRRRRRQGNDKSIWCHNWTNLWQDFGKIPRISVANFELHPEHNLRNHYEITHFWKIWQRKVSLCGNVRIFPSFIFYVKSILRVPEVQKMLFLRF